ncbi:GNAT family N-acetyltransferase [Methanolobus sp. ZRKC3]|uniref:GNAT family N-acetyltransferase n=1 Tax=Methanolobus sp. ZRKC3 TaxID=3125786 RepID=UPI0032461001
MTQDLVIRETTEEDYDEVRHFIEMVDEEFYPPLSKRGESIAARVKRTLATQNSNYLLAQLKIPDPSDKLNGFVGLIGYTNKWKSEADSYINFLASHPAYRKYGVSKLLCVELEKMLCSIGIKRIYLCTWSSNLAAMRFYEKLGYNAYSVILNDRGKGIDTLNYRKNISPAEFVQNSNIRLNNRLEDKFTCASK